MGSEVIIAPFFFAVVGFIIWTLVGGWQRRQQLQMMTEFNTRLLDKLGSVKDFNDLIQTEAGARLVGGVTAERGTNGARNRILNAIQLGVVFVALGFGFLYLGSTPLAGGRFSLESQEALTIFGVIGLSLGVGLLLSAGASYVVARSLGILGANPQES